VEEKQTEKVRPYSGPLSFFSLAGVSSLMSWGDPNRAWSRLYRLFQCSASVWQELPFPTRLLSARPWNPFRVFSDCWSRTGWRGWWMTPLGFTLASNDGQEL
jgi:hypothetical protein